MFKLTTELMNISHFNVVEADRFTVQLKEGSIQKSKKVLKVDAILIFQVFFSVDREDNGRRLTSNR